MDFHYIADGALALLTILAGIIMKSIDNRITKLEDHNTLLPAIYARRDDVKEGFAKIDRTLERIENKLDGKADRYE